MKKQADQYREAEATGKERRKGRRQPVLWKSVIRVGSHSFDCVVFDVSLGGARLKFDLPLKQGAAANLVIRDQWSFPATVIWQDGRHMGLKFEYDESRTRVIFGPLADRL